MTQFPHRCSEIHNRHANGNYENTMVFILYMLSNVCDIEALINLLIIDNRLSMSHDCLDNQQNFIKKEIEPGDVVTLTS